MAGKISLLLVLALTNVGLAQWNNTKYDTRKWNLGFTMGLHMGFVRLDQGDIDPDPITGLIARDVRARPVPGINLGLIANLPLHRYFDLRFVPQVSLQQRDFTYRVRDTTFDRRLQASYMDLPLMIRFKSQFYHNYRVYVMTGLKYSLNLTSEKRVKDDPDLIKIDRKDLSIEFAWGLTLYGDRVMLSPELRYSLGVLNVYSPERTEYGNAIRSIANHTLTFSLNFE
ncbi:MAG: porin family protein [Sphingobacteriia bacterium]